MFAVAVVPIPVVDADGCVPAQGGPLGVVRDLVVESHHQMIYQVLHDHMAMYSHRPHMIILYLSNH